MQEPDPRISALLRLKRFEQPPPGYFERMLSEVQQRQRAELLRRSLWQIAVERVQVFFSEHSMGSLSYAGAMAAVLLVGVAGIGLMTPGNQEQRAVASVERPAPPVAADSHNRFLVLGPQSNSPMLTPPQELPVSAPFTSPRYVIDARPVSYEPAPAFSF
jgi:hypothetical protein